MSLKARLEDDLKTAMRSGETVKRDTLRLVLAALKNKRIETGAELSDDEVLAVLASNVKSRQDSAQQYEQAGRQELADKEQAEIEIIQVYLPKQLSSDETRELVTQTIAELGLESKSQLGQLMKAVMATHKNVIDGKLVQRFAAEILA